MKKFLAIVLAYAMIFAFAACGMTTAASAAEAPAEPTHLLEKPLEFKATFSSSLESALGKNMQAAYDAITERTNGDLVFEIFPSSQLGNTTETLEQMRAGAPIICCLGFDNAGDYVDELAIASAPYVFNDTNEVEVLAASDWMKDVEVKMNEVGFAPLAYGSLGYRHFISTKPIYDASSIRGMIVRMGNASLAQNFITVMGGNPTTSTWSDNYSDLQQGIFDACEASAELLWTSSLYEVCDYLTLSGHFVTPTILTMNIDCWNAIPAEYQAIVREELQNGMHNALVEMTEQESDFIEKFREAGTEIIETDKSTFSAYVPELLERQSLDASVFEVIRAAIDSNK